MFDLDDFFLNEETQLHAQDTALLESRDCLGCTNCCRELSAQIILDAWDIALLKEGLGLSFDELLEKGYICLAEQGRALLPAFACKPDVKECVFLNEDGRCKIHPFRAGICRMYPLARRWKEDGSFYYFLQKGECEHRERRPAVIADWLGYPDIEVYERAITAYHAKLKRYRAQCMAAKTPEELEAVHGKFLDGLRTEEMSCYDQDGEDHRGAR